MFNSGRYFSVRVFQGFVWYLSDACCGQRARNATEAPRGDICIASVPPVPQRAPRQATSTALARKIASAMLKWKRRCARLFLESRAGAAAAQMCDRPGAPPYAALPATPPG